MEKIILIFIILAAIYMFINVYKLQFKLEKNNIVENMKKYDKKKKTKQQESKILDQRSN